MDWNTLLLPLLLSITTAKDSKPSDRTSRFVKFSTEIIKYLETISDGPFECWFYQQQPSDHSIIQHIRTSDAIKYVPRRVLSSPFNANAVKIERASLVFFEFRSNLSFFHEQHVLWRVTAKTKLVIIAKGHSCRDIPGSIHDIFKSRFAVYYFFEDADLICRSLPLTKEVLEYDRSVPLEVLFEDRSHQMKGHPINCIILGHYNLLYAYIEGRGVGPSLCWLNATAKLVNATLGLIFATCHELDDECWWNVIMRKEGGFNDMILDINSVTGFNPIVMPRIDVSSYVIVTPRGRYLGVEELFTAPFSVAVWIVLVLFVISLKFVEVNFSTYFRNDLILLPLCGLEKHNFLKSSRIERITLTALILFFFVILSVYEVKIMTLMTNRPRRADIRSIEDLNQKGIKVLVPPKKIELKEEQNLDLKFEYFNGSRSLDGIHSYLFDEESALLLRHMCNGDEELSSSYTILDEKVRMFIRSNYIFSPSLMDPFRWTHEALIESGIHTFLKESVVAQNVGGWSNFKSYQKHEQVTSMLNIDDLLPAWYSIGIGSAIGFCTFLLEIVTKIRLFSLFKSKFRVLPLDS